MRIISVECFRVSIPLKNVYQSVKRQEAVAKNVLDDVFVRLVLDDGSVGFGEAAPVPFVGETPRTVSLVIEEVLGKKIVGREFSSCSEIARAMDSAIRGNYAAKAAVEIALYDALGKSLGKPIYSLLGGRLKDAPQVCDLVPTVSLDALPEYVEQIVKRGVKVLKVKVGAGASEDVERVKTIREVAGDGVRLHVDPGESWLTAKRAINIIKKMERYGVDIVEQPILAHDIDGLAEVRRGVDTPIAVDESLTYDTAPILASRRCADFFGMKFQRIGGYANMLRIAELAEQMGVECITGVLAVNTQILDSALSHLFISSRNYTLNESGRSVFWVDNRLFEGLNVSDGKIKLSEQAGLGVVVNEEMLSEFVVERLQVKTA